MLRNLVLNLGIILFCFPVAAQNISNGVFKFLYLPNSAKVAALGSALPLSDQPELSEAFHNPSLLNTNHSNKLAINYTALPAGINLGAAQYAFTFKGEEVLSAGLLFVNYGDFDETDAGGNPTGNTFSAGDYLLNLGYANNWQKKIYYGSNLKLIYSSYDVYQSIAITTDLTFSYKDTTHNFLIGFGLRNLGYQIKPFNQTREKLPFSTDLVFSKRLKYAPIRYHITYSDVFSFNSYRSSLNQPTNLEGEQDDVSLSFVNKFSRHLTFGTELLLSPAFNLFAAYNIKRQQELKVAGTGGRTGLSLGFAINLKYFNFSYANANLNPAGSNNTFSLQLNPILLTNKIKSKTR